MYMNYEEKKFNLPELAGISKESVDQHLGLYGGYVKNFNAISMLAGELMRQDPQKNMLAIAELIRRRSFEFGGMRLHEHYFPQFEGGPKTLDENGALNSAVAAQYGKIEYCMAEIREVAMMRGPGWSILYWDPTVKQFLVGFSEQQHQGHFVTLPIVLALDVWEHAYLLDYGALGKAKYIDAFFNNINWDVIEGRFVTLSK